MSVQCYIVQTLLYTCIVEHSADRETCLHSIVTPYDVLVPECCIITLGCTMQTTQFPVRAMSGLYYI